MKDIVQRKETVSPAGSRPMGGPMSASVQSGLSASKSLDTSGAYGDGKLNMSGSGKAGYHHYSKEATTGSVSGGFKIDGGR